MRWFLRMQEFYFALENMPDKDNMVAGGLSAMSLRPYDADTRVCITDFSKCGQAEDLRGVDWYRTRGVTFTQKHIC